MQSRLGICLCLLLCTAEVGIFMDFARSQASELLPKPLAVMKGSTMLSGSEFLNVVIQTKIVRSL